MTPEPFHISFGGILMMVALISFAIFGVIESWRKGHWTSRVLAGAFLAYVAVFVGRNFSQQWPPASSLAVVPVFAWIVALSLILGGGLFVFLWPRRAGR